MTHMPETLLRAAIARGSVQRIEGLAERMTQHAQDIAAVEQKPWLPSERQRVITEHEVQLRADVAQLVETAKRRRLHAFDQEEGTLRAEAKATGAEASDATVRGQVFRHTRASQLASLAERAGTPEAAQTVFAEAQLTDDAETIRLVGLSVQQRLATLAAADKDQRLSAKRTAALLFDQAFSAWRRAHPSTVERLAEIARQRGNAAIEFEASAEFALRVYGVGRERPAPTLREMPDVEPAGDGLQVGPAFDRRA
jgi:hypothetical protein